LKNAVIGCRLNTALANAFHRKLNETHKTQSDLLSQIIETYFEFERAGYLSADGSKIAKLETEIQLKQKLRDIEAAKYQDKLNYEKELQAIKNENAKERARDRAARNAPKVDWGESAGGYVEGASDNFVLGDR
jgi:parvulin-like peptidyl-prolyl isomerase